MTIIAHGGAAKAVGSQLTKTTASSAYSAKYAVTKHSTTKTAFPETPNRRSGSCIRQMMTKATAAAISSATTASGK